MTEEELEKEAGEYAKPFYNMTRYDYVEERTHIKEAYLAGAEPREKRIIELKDENNKLLDVINNQDVKIADLEKKIEQAKEIIKNLLILKNDHYGNTKMEWRVEVTEQAEQFLKENK